MSMCRVFSCVVGRGCLLWPVFSLGKTLLAFALLHFVLQGQSGLLLQVFLDFLLSHYSPLWWKRHLSLLLVVEGLINQSQKTNQTWPTWTTALCSSMKLWAMPCKATKMDGSWWRVLIKHGLLKKGMAKDCNILALRTPWTVWKSKNIWHWKISSPGQ